MSVCVVLPWRYVIEFRDEFSNGAVVGTSDKSVGEPYPGRLTTCCPFLSLAERRGMHSKSGFSGGVPGCVGGGMGEVPMMHGRRRQRGTASRSARCSERYVAEQRCHGKSFDKRGTGQPSQAPRLGAMYVGMQKLRRNLLGTRLSSARPQSLGRWHPL